MKKAYRLLLVAVVALGLLGCGDKEDPDGYKMYYLNRDVTQLVAKVITPSSNELNTEGLVEEFIADLDNEPEDVECQPALLGNVTITKYDLSNGTLRLYFSAEYNELDAASAMLCRAAVVKTMVQIPEVDDVYFYVGETPLTDSKGKIIGILTADSFVENPGSQINYSETKSITLYFTNESGESLIPEVQTVHYISSISMEKLVVEQLIAGPETEGYYPTIPSDTKIISVTSMDGICYVNLDDGFLVQNYSVSEPVVIYSIVNSIFALNDGIGKVQITVNGQSNLYYRESISLDQSFTRNLDLIQEEIDEIPEAEVELVSE